MKTSPFDLTGRAALVTGSTRGIGAAIASSLGSAGARVIRHGIGAPPDGTGHYLEADLSDPANAHPLIDRALALDPDLDILVCNAGSFFDSPFLEMDRDRWSRTMHLNLESPYLLIQRFAQLLIERGRGGAVVIIGSTNGFQAERDSTAYDISKGGLVMMTRSLSLALAGHGIRVNSVAPGLIRTPLTAGWMDQRPEVVAHYERKIPCGRIGSPEDCAGACVFLCSDAAAYLIGQTLVVDGGLTVGQIGDLPPA